MKSQVEVELENRIKAYPNDEFKNQLISLFESTKRIHQAQKEFDIVTQKQIYQDHVALQNNFKNFFEQINGNSLMSLQSIKNPEEFFSQKEIEKLQQEFSFNTKVTYKDLFLCIPYLQRFISNEDKKVLAYLQDFSANKFEENDNIELVFSFKENPYLETGIYKILYVIDENSDFQDGLIRIQSDQLDWKPEKNYTIKKLQKNKIKRILSFFWIFKSFKAEDFDQDDDAQEYDMDETSDFSIFNMSKEIMSLFQFDFYAYSLLQFFGVEIEELQVRDDDSKNDSEYESVEEDEE